MNSTRLQTSTALLVTTAALAVCGATLVDMPSSDDRFPAGAGPVGPAAATTPLRQVEATAGSAANDPIGTSDRIADQAISTVRTVRDGALHSVGSTATAALGAATQTVGSAVDTVGQVDATALRTVGPVAATAVTTVGQTETFALGRVATSLAAVQSIVGDATSIVVSLTSLNAAADVDVLDATGTITVSDGSAVLATAQLEHGKATVTVNGPILRTAQLTISYGGDSLFAPSTASL